jgi:hypothetical protein
MKTLNDYSDVAKKVWAAQSADEKQQILLKAVKEFVAKGENSQNVKRFQSTIRKASTPNELDRIAAQLALFPDNRVV